MSLIDLINTKIIEDAVFASIREMSFACHGDASELRLSYRLILGSQCCPMYYLCRFYQLYAGLRTSFGAEMSHAALLARIARCTKLSAGKAVCGQDILPPQCLSAFADGLHLEEYLVLRRRPLRLAGQGLVWSHGSGTSQDSNKATRKP